MSAYQLACMIFDRDSEAGVEPIDIIDNILAALSDLEEPMSDQPKPDPDKDPLPEPDPPPPPPPPPPQPSKEA